MFNRINYKDFIRQLLVSAVLLFNLFSQFQIAWSQDIKPKAVVIGLNITSTPEVSEQILLQTLRDKLVNNFDLSSQSVFEKFIINGQKIWTSRAEHSDLMLLLVRTEDREKVRKRTEGLSVFIVDMRTALDNGLTIRPIRTMLNHSTTEVFFDELEIPQENLIGEEGNGFRYIMDGMNAERILIASECIGDSRWFTAKSTNYANARVVFNRPIGKNQGIQFPIAEAYAATEAAALMTEKAAIMYEDGESSGAEANMAKLLASEASWKAAEACMQTHGGFGFAEEYDVERKYRETRLYQIAPISTNLILSYIAEHVLGLPRSY